MRMTVFSFIADVLSIIGFLVTIYVAWRVRSIRKEYLLLGRAPEQAARLQQRADELVPLLNDTTENQQELLRMLASVEVGLRSLRASLSGDLLQTTNRLYDHVRRLQGLPVRFRWLRWSVVGAGVGKSLAKGIEGSLY